MSDFQQNSTDGSGLVNLANDNFQRKKSIAGSAGSATETAAKMTVDVAAGNHMVSCKIA